MNKYDNELRKREVALVNSYLKQQGYDSVPEWALDSGYMNMDDDGDDWYDEHGNIVDIHKYLVGIANGDR